MTFRGEGYHRSARREKVLELMTRSQMLTRSERVVVALGILTGPSDITNRRNCRSTWMTDAPLRDDRVYARFVVGDVRLSSACKASMISMLRQEQEMHRDFAFVAAPDCLLGHSAEKVHAWYRYALDAVPSSIWIAKMEDDGLLWPSGLLLDLGRLQSADYYGVLRWAGSCVRAEPTSSCTRSCYAGAFQGGHAGSFLDSVERTPRVSCRLPSLTQSCLVYKHVRCCDDACPDGVAIAPFANGPLEVRSRKLAHSVARCERAHRFFRAASVASDASARDRRDFRACTATDAAQATALELCTPTNAELRLADTTDSRLSQGSVCGLCSRCGRGSVLVHHHMAWKNVSSVSLWAEAW